MTKNKFKWYWEKNISTNFSDDLETEKHITFGTRPNWNYNTDIRFFLFLKSLLNVKENELVLDVGCGPLARAEIHLGFMKVKTVGIDISKTMVRRAKKHIEEYKMTNNVFLVIGDAETLPFINKVFDAAICIGTISHLPTTGAARKVIGEMSRTLLENKSVYIDWFQNLYSFFGVIDVIFIKIVDLIGKPRAQFLKFRGLNEIQKIFYNNNFNIKQVLFFSTIGIITWASCFFPKFIVRVFFRVQETLDQIYRKLPILRKYSRMFIIIAKKEKHMPLQGS